LRAIQTAAEDGRFSAILRGGSGSLCRFRTSVPDRLADPRFRFVS
jgi:hypothetical protein